MTCCLGSPLECRAIVGFVNVSVLTPHDPSNSSAARAGPIGFQVVDYLVEQNLGAGALALYAV